MILLETLDSTLKGETVWIEQRKCINCEALSFGLLEKSYETFWLENSVLRRSDAKLKALEIYNLPPYLSDFEATRYWNGQLLCVSKDSGALVRINPTETLKPIELQPCHPAVEIVIPKQYVLFGKYLSIQNSIEKWE